MLRTSLTVAVVLGLATAGGWYYVEHRTEIRQTTVQPTPSSTVPSDSTSQDSPEDLRRKRLEEYGSVRDLKPVEPPDFTGR
jgi:hypothetical protein